MGGKEGVWISNAEPEGFNAWRGCSSFFGIQQKAITFFCYDYEKGFSFYKIGETKFHSASPYFVFTNCGIDARWLHP